MQIRAARTAALSICASHPALCAGLAALFLAFGSQGLQIAKADGETRSLTMHHMHTGEDINIVYKRNGKYDEDALDKINWFLRDWRRQEKTRMDPHLLDVIWEVYRDVGGSEPIQIVCGFRSPATNSMLRRRSSGVARFSQHTLGKATDFYIPGVPLEQQRYAGLRLQRGGVGYYPTSGSPFIHLDTGNVRHWPRMPEAQLARVLRDHHRPIHVVSRITKPSAGSDAAAEAQKPKRNFLAKLFGFADAEEGDEEDAQISSQVASASSRAPAATAHPETAKPSVVAAAVPMPAARPARAGQFALASASSIPVTLTPPTQTPADIIKSRVDWRSEPVTDVPAVTVAASAPPPGAIGANGQRFVWIAGPPGRPVQEDPPRPKADLTGAAAAPDTTASLGDWPNNARTDRVPTDVALAYAAAPAPEPRTRSLASVVETPRQAPADAARPARAAAAVALPPPASAVSSSIQKSAPRIQDPWLRGVVMAPSAYYSMRVALLGSQDYRNLKPFMHKPSSTVAMVFTVDPYSGMSSEYFGGSAVAFVPTITFATRTAALN